jgi:hypothetical protein
MVTTMIDGNLLFSLELCALVVLVGVGLWRISRTRQSAAVNASASVAYDMRRAGNGWAPRPLLDDAFGNVTPRYCSIWFPVHLR